MSLTDLGYIILFILTFALLGFASWSRFNFIKGPDRETENGEFEDDLEVKEFDHAFKEDGSRERRKLFPNQLIG
jgi:hypothetical protein